MKATRSFSRMLLDAQEITDEAMNENLQISLSKERALRRIIARLNVVITRLERYGQVQPPPDEYLNRFQNPRNEIEEAQFTINAFDLFLEDLAAAKLTLKKLLESRDVNREELSYTNEVLYKFWMVLTW